MQEHAPLSPRKVQLRSFALLQVRGYVTGISGIDKRRVFKPGKDMTNAMATQVLVLNASYEPVNVTAARRALVLIAIGLQVLTAA